MALQRYPLNRFDTSIAGAGASYFIGDVFADLPTSSLRIGDLGYDIATGKLYVANSSTTFAEKGASGPAGPPGSGGINTVVTYGALPNDLTNNDTAAVQACINAESVVYFPPGTYRVSGLVPRNGQRFVGLGGQAAHEGATGSTGTRAFIAPTANGVNCFTMSNSIGGIHGPTWENLVFANPGGFTGCTAIRAANYNRLTVNWCSFMDMDYGIWMSQAGDSAWHNFFGNNFYAMSQAGVYSDTGYGYTLVGGDMINSSVIAVNLNQHIRIYGVKFDGKSSGAASSIRLTSASEVTDCTFENTAIGIDVVKEGTGGALPGKGVLISGCIFNSGIGSILGIRLGALTTKTMILAPMVAGGTLLTDNSGGNYTLAYDRS